ncbi:MAG: hypothetical protein ACPGEG_09340 [Salibacteraceae bacterium]
MPGLLVSQKKSLKVLSIGWITYIFFFTARKEDLQIPELINSYFTDLLCIPLVLGTIQLFIRIIKNEPKLKLTIPMVIFSVVAFSLAFEWWFPKQNSIYTADILDVVCYVIGGLVFTSINQSKFS